MNFVHKVLYDPLANRPRTDVLTERNEVCVGIHDSKEYVATYFARAKSVAISIEQ